MSLLDTASLIVTPNGYKEGKLYSVIPSDGSGDMSVVRATTATRVNSAGLVELVPYNLLGYSQDFTNAYWNKNNGNGGTLPIVTANYATNPFGASNASRIQLQRTSTSGSYSQVFTAVTLQNATQYTWSVWLKSLSGTPTITIAYNGASYSTITLTNEWVRYELPLTTNGSYFEANFGTYQSEASTSLTADFLAWGFQLVEGSTAKDYQKTETRLNIPRLDYSNGTCPSLLVEPQRTNLLTYSSSLDNAAWTKSNVTINANAVISPSGIQDADKLIETTATGAHRIFPTSTSGLNGTFSFFAKSGERTKVAILSTIIDLGFDLSNGTLIDLGSGTSSGKIEDYGNGWYRCSLYQSTGIVSLSIGLLNNSNAISYTGDGTSGTYIWGAQLENASYQTSYIPTTSASVTRNADVISKTGISSLIGQTEGTLFLDLQYSNTNGTDMLLSIRPNVSNKLEIFTDGGVIYAEVHASNSFSIFSTQPIGSYKIALAYKSGSTALYINGTLIGQSATTFTFTNTLADLYLNSRGGSSFIEAANFNSVALWKTRLTNTQLATLTTL
jgi:hypothetical protein